jgi:2-amino-4-hydroxy-6-hydroxymethyldihydropteridine diphosphokinase
MQNKCFISVGSNIEPETHLNLAKQEFEECFNEVKVSSTYKSPSFGFSGPDFLNLVLLIDSEQCPLGQMILFIKALENKANRVRTKDKLLSRTLDLDILVFSSAIKPDYNIPHTDILKYPFVYVPLLELEKNFSHPLTGVPLKNTISQVSANSLSKVVI